MEPRIMLNWGNVYIATVVKMGSVFDFWNKRYFNGNLEKPVITVCKDCRGRAYGWFVPARIWKRSDDDEGHPEINMCSQYLNRSFVEIAQTMLHEMCHLYAFLQEIADTSANGRYHNLEFKKIAEEHGLIVKKSKSRGYSITELTESSKAMLSEYKGDRTFLYDVRPRASKEDFVSEAEKKAKKERPPVAKYAYVCPQCGQKVKGFAKAQSLLCAVCKVALEQVEK